MDLVIDANILFAALIKEGKTAELLFLDDLHLFAPEFLLEEFAKHRKTILKKTHRTDREFDKILDVLSARINFIPKEEIMPLMQRGEEISPDPDDSTYFAVALRVGASLWTNDLLLKNQDSIKTYTTSELIKLFTQ